jgi:hypothetical protein
MLIDLLAFKWPDTGFEQVIRFIGILQKLTTSNYRAIVNKRIMQFITTSVKYFPAQWKVGKIILHLKPGKLPNEPMSYRPISLLPILSKVYEKLLLHRLLPITENRRLLPDHQFGFRQRHSTIHQTHRIVHKINEAIETKQYCSAAFLDISQAFDRVWHTGLLHKLRQCIPLYYYLILKSYLHNKSRLKINTHSYIPR